MTRRIPGRTRINLTAGKAFSAVIMLETVFYISQPLGFGEITVVFCLIGSSRDLPAFISRTLGFFLNLFLRLLSLKHGI